MFTVIVNLSVTENCVKNLVSQMLLLLVLAQHKQMLIYLLD